MKADISEFLLKLLNQPFECLDLTWHDGENVCLPVLAQSVSDVSRDVIGGAVVPCCVSR